MVDGQVLATQTLNHNQRGKFFDVDTPLPADWIKGKTKITIRLQPAANSTAGGLFRCAVLKSAE